MKINKRKSSAIRSKEIKTYFDENLAEKEALMKHIYQILKQPDKQKMIEDWRKP